MVWGWGRGRGHSEGLGGSGDKLSPLTRKPRLAPSHQSPSLSVALLPAAVSRGKYQKSKGDLRKSPAFTNRPRPLDNAMAREDSTPWAQAPHSGEAPPRADPVERAGAPPLRHKTRSLTCLHLPSHTVHPRFRDRKTFSVAEVVSSGCRMERMRGQREEGKEGRTLEIIEIPGDARLRQRQRRNHTLCAGRLW